GVPDDPLDGVEAEYRHDQADRAQRGARVHEQDGRPHRAGRGGSGRLWRHLATLRVGLVHVGSSPTPASVPNDGSWFTGTAAHRSIAVALSLDQVTDAAPGYAARRRARAAQN